MCASRKQQVRSADNRFQRLEVLKTNREKRGRYGEFIIEGVIAINSAVRAGWPIRALVYAAGRQLSDWALQLIAGCPAEEHLVLSPELMERISDKDDTSEIIAVGCMPADDFKRIPLSSRSAVAVFDRPASPGNLGSSIRSCEAFSLDGVVITGHAADPYDPHAVRGSMGGLFRLPVVRCGGPGEVLAWCDSARSSEAGLRIIGTSARAERHVDELDWREPGPVLLVFGNETRGLSEAWRAGCDELVKIPMSGGASSLNVSCAVSIVLYERARQLAKITPAVTG